MTGQRSFSTSAAECRSTRRRQNFEVPEACCGAAKINVGRKAAEVKGNQISTCDVHSIQFTKPRASPGAKSSSETTNKVSSHYTLAPDFTASVIDGHDVPTTTDVPRPETTDGSSDIATVYSFYVQYCGQSFTDAHDSAVADYTYNFNKAPDDPNATDFIAWAYVHSATYKNAYRMCAVYEDTYKQLLATFVPDTPSATTPTVTGTSARATTTAYWHESSSTTVAGQTNDEGSNDDSSPPQTGDAIASISMPITLTLTVVVAVQILM
ncbi:hypothetical protein GGX14DRAFT_398852 [Mycena pura]|uniref:Uncharacterized protein n=1 Tax=Mycena pura TaxID=153505 RepID=A0AAD6Y959_9AGAR|nr:hypothetical protein GGX14DRAFT_398852 [Mycena pura]